MFKMTEENSIANDNKTPLLSDSTVQNSFNEDQSACHLIINPMLNPTVHPYSSNSNLIQQKHFKLTNHNIDDQALPSNRHLFNSRPSTICYQTFQNDTNSPFNTPLKRSRTFTGVFGSIFNKQTELLKTQLENSSYQKFNKLNYSKSNYDYNDKFASSEPLPNEFNNRRMSTSSTSFMPNLIDVQNIKQNLVSMAVVMTKHQFSNTGRLLTQQQSSQIQNLDSRRKSVDIPNSLSNSSTSTSVSSSSYINNDGSTVALQEDLQSLNLNFCALCLQYIDSNEFVILRSCKCGFCKSCLEQYCQIVIREHLLTSSQITCPSTDCQNFNSYLVPEQIEELVDQDTYKLYEKIKLDFEVHLDYPNRVWCPRPNCETVCVVSSTQLKNIRNLDNDSNKNSNEQKISRRVPVKCSKCNFTFCLHCRNDYHGTMPCQSQSEDESLSLVLSRTRTPNSLNECIKKCPQCGIYIEKDKGCGQMMCQKCKHVFCWFCLSSLEEDFLLRHYDSGACKNKLGHSKAVLLWLRFQVIAVFLGFALFLLLISPILLISAPMLLIAHYCCNLSIRTKIWTKEDYLDESQNNLQNTNKVPTANDNNQSSSQTDQLIDLSSEQVNLEVNPIENPEPSKHQQLIQAYIQNNGNHKSIGESLSSLNRFEEHPIRLSGYDQTVEQKNKSFFSSWFGWFGRKDKSDPAIPKLSSLLDIEKHQKFIEELMADRLSLDNQMNSVDLEKHFIIISPAELDNQSDFKEDGKKLKWWKWPSQLNSESKKDVNLV